ncbi:helix-turn-helix transcriptional regulator [Priestia sp. FSL R5-0597]|uniref:helix-turn-helix domain-containing protein n=1 Tax=Priestia sp. FSL R5-0597 TaxID=2921580 RepID=UPI0030F5018D
MENAIVKNRLAIIMAEKEIRSVSKLQELMELKGHKIARRTLDRLYKNDNNQIHYDTIAAICVVLDIQPGDFFTLVEVPKEQDSSGESE